jgi:hypothetical protein
MSNLNPQQFLYHVSPKYNKEDIIHQGLDPYQDQNEWGSRVRRRVYMAPSEEDAIKWSREVELTHNEPTKMSLFKVDVSGLRPRRRKTDIGLHEYSVPHEIEASRVQHIKDFSPDEEMWKQ